MSAQIPETTSPSRIAIIDTVKTPLGFFVLVVLVVEAMLGITANFSQGTDRTYLIIGMLILIFLLVFIVAGLAVFRPEALIGLRPSTQTSEFVAQSLSNVATIEKPVLLLACASISHAKSYLDSDEKIISEIFPKRQIKVHQGFTSSELTIALTDKEYDILHLTIPVDKDTGELIFSDDDKLSTEAFSKLVELCKAKLVVLAICDSLMLATKVARTTNMIASTGIVQDKDVQEWEQTFYKLLSRGHALSRAYDIARITSNIQMVMLMKQDFMIVMK